MTQETIKPQDLRIGNWVAFEGEDKPCKVDEITDTGFINDIKVEWVFGIELSEEILIKAGFKIFPWGYVKKSNNDFGVRINLNSFNYDVSGNNPVKLQYLHQLQNLFYSLTNEELTINL